MHVLTHLASAVFGSVYEGLGSREMLHHVVVLAVVCVYHVVRHDATTARVRVARATSRARHVEHVRYTETTQVGPVVGIVVTADIHVVIHARRRGGEHRNDVTAQDVVDLMHVVDICAERSTMAMLVVVL